MIAATVAVLAAGTSLFDLIQTATPGQLNTHSGCIAEVSIQWGGGTFHLVYKDGTVNTATDSGFLFSDPATAANAGVMVIRGATGMNVLSLKNIYLSGAGGTARIAAYSI